MEVSGQLHAPVTLLIGKEYHWVGGWVGPGTGLDMVVKGKIPSPYQELNPRTLIVQPIA
jgi:hypothetical protein